MTTINDHRSKEYLGGIVFLLTIDMSVVTKNPLHVRHFVNSYGTNGAGVQFQGKTFSPHPYSLKEVKRNVKSNRAGAKVLISDNEDFAFSRFIDEVGGTLQGARVIEMKVYGDFLDTGINPNPLAYVKRLDHLVNYVEDTEKVGEKSMHTTDPLSKDLKVPRISFSSGLPNGKTSHINVFPAVDRRMSKDR